jgi:hypothetical protein
VSPPMQAASETNKPEPARVGRPKDHKNAPMGKDANRDSGWAGPFRNGNDDPGTPSTQERPTMSPIQLRWRMDLP